MKVAILILAALTAASAGAQTELATNVPEASSSILAALAGAFALALRRR